MATTALKRLRSNSVNWGKIAENEETRLTTKGARTAIWRIAAYYLGRAVLPVIEHEERRSAPAANTSIQLHRIERILSYRIIQTEGEIAGRHLRGKRRHGAGEIVEHFVIVPLDVGNGVADEEPGVEIFLTQDVEHAEGLEEAVGVPRPSGGRGRGREF